MLSLERIKIIEAEFAGFYSWDNFAELAARTCEAHGTGDYLEIRAGTLLKRLPKQFRKRFYQHMCEADDGINS